MLSGCIAVQAIVIVLNPLVFSRCYNSHANLVVCVRLGWNMSIVIVKFDCDLPNHIKNNLVITISVCSVLCLDLGEGGTESLGKRSRDLENIME